MDRVRNIRDENASELAAIMDRIRNVRDENASELAAIMDRIQNVTDENASELAAIMDRIRNVRDENASRLTAVMDRVRKIRDENASRLTAVMDRVRNIRDENASRLTAIMDRVRNIRDENASELAAIMDRIRNIRDENASELAAIMDRIRNVRYENASELAAIMDRIQNVTDENASRLTAVMDRVRNIRDENSSRLTAVMDRVRNIRDENGGVSATICSQHIAIQDGSRKYGREQEEQASTRRAGDHGPRKDANPKTYSASRLTVFMDWFWKIRDDTGSRDFAGSPALKYKQGGRVSRTSGNKGSKSNWEVEEGCTAVDNRQCELIDMDDTCSVEQASAARAGDHGPASQLPAIMDWIRNIRDENAGRAGAHGPRKDANPKTYSGLQNQGSTCYLNTVLQILFMTEDCRRAVMRLNEADGNPVSEQLKKLFDKLIRNQVPDTRGITHSLGITDVCRQEDASEYFKKILSKVNPDVTKIYEGTIEETVTCKKKHQLKNDSSPFTLIPLSINNPFSGIISVEDAWKDHFKRTEATLYCNSCESETLAQFESKINVFPQILALHLDRLDIFSGQKNTCKVKIPSTLTDKGQTYELYAIANHYGSPRGGHYNAFIKPYGDECWWLFDDSHVRKMEELQRENLLNSPAADLLFYKKISYDLKAENTLEKGNDSYPSQDHRKRPSKSKPAAWIAAEDLSSSRRTIREGRSPEPVGAGAATAMGASGSGQHRQHKQIEEKPMVARAAGQAKIRELHGQHEQAVKQKTLIFHIAVNGFSDKLIVIKFECLQAKFDSTTTLELKEKIIAEHLKGSGVETDSVRLFFASTPMDDEKTFSHYGIQNMSTVMMITRMPGGWKPQSVP